MKRFPTIVTCFYNIRRLDASDPSHNRQVDKYMEFANQFILQLPYPIAIFIDDKDVDGLEPFIRNIRDTKFPGKTRIFKEPIENTYFYAHLDKIRELQSKFIIINGDPKHETPLYIALNNNKFHFMEIAINENFANSSHFVWIDFGINHIARDVHRIHDWILEIPDKIKMMCINPYLEGDNQKEFFRFIYHHNAGGLFSGDIAHMRKFIDAFKAKFHEMARDDWYQVDEAIMSLILRDHPDWFVLFYGDYQGIISNYKEPLHNMDLIYHMLEKSLCFNVSEYVEDILTFLEPFIEKPENQHGYFFYEFLRVHLIYDYYSNHRYIHTSIIRLMNSKILEKNVEMAYFIQRNQHLIDFYENRELILPIEYLPN